MSGRIFVEKILRLGYFWYTMKTDCAKFVKKYTHAKFIGIKIMYCLMSCIICFHLSLLLRGALISLGKSTLTASDRHKFIVVARLFLQVSRSSVL